MRAKKQTQCMNVTEYATLLCHDLKSEWVCAVRLSMDRVDFREAVEQPLGDLDQGLV